MSEIPRPATLPVFGESEAIASCKQVLQRIQSGADIDNDERLIHETGAAHLIVKATEFLNPPHRFLLGNDAYEAATKRIEELRKEFSELEMVSRVADFPKDMQGQSVWTVSKSRR